MLVSRDQRDTALIRRLDNVRKVKSGVVLHEEFMDDDARTESAANCLRTLHEETTDLAAALPAVKAADRLDSV